MHLLFLSHHSAIHFAYRANLRKLLYLTSGSFISRYNFSAGAMEICIKRKFNIQKSLIMETPF